MLPLGFWQVSPAAAITFFHWLTHLLSSRGEQQSCAQNPSIAQELACASPQNRPLQKQNLSESRATGAHFPYRQPCQGVQWQVPAAVQCLAQAGSTPSLAVGKSFDTWLKKVIKATQETFEKAIRFWHVDGAQTSLAAWLVRSGWGSAWSPWQPPGIGREQEDTFN